jgi:DNA polymerase I-like protein with 3'-5' exonuclease and polymerase domains
MPMTLDEAKVISRVYRNTYQGVPQYWNNQITRVRTMGFAETFAGRRVKVMGEWLGRNGWSMGSTAINFRIQGTGADQKYLAMMCIEDTVRDVGGYFAWDLHDGIYLYIPVDRVEEAAVKIKDILDNLPYGSAWGFHPPIPMPWDCKVGPSWGDLKEFKFN